MGTTLVHNVAKLKKYKRKKQKKMNKNKEIIKRQNFPLLLGINHQLRERARNRYDTSNS